MKLRAQHFMASGALPPGFAAVEIDGEYFWDGGLMSNTPLYEIVQTTLRRDTLAFQVDLWKHAWAGARQHRRCDGAREGHSVLQPDATDTLQRSQRFRNVLREVLDKVPVDIRNSDPWCKTAEELACSKRFNVIHLIYRHKEYEGNYKDFQFGLSTMREHWESGLSDICGTLTHRDWLDMPNNDAGFITHDIHRDGR